MSVVKFCNKIASLLKVRNYEKILPSNAIYQRRYIPTVNHEAKWIFA